MNHEIISALAPSEYYKAFLEKNIRPDKRQLLEHRGFVFSTSVLDTEDISATSCLGEGNRILGVLKINKSEAANNCDQDNIINNEQNPTDNLDNPENQTSDFKINNKFNIVTDFGDNVNFYFNENDVLAFTDKILRDNIEYKVNGNYTLYLRFLMVDGNIHDTLGNLLNNLFKCEKVTKLIVLKNDFQTSTFTQIQNKLIIDPDQTETEIAESIYSLIVFNKSKFVLHKIKGVTVEYRNIKSVLELICKS